MTDVELLAWGIGERKARMADIADVKAGLKPLEAAQWAARQRMKLAGLRRNDVDYALRKTRIAENT